MSATIIVNSLDVSDYYLPKEVNLQNQSVEKRNQIRTEVED